MKNVRRISEPRTRLASDSLAYAILRSAELVACVLEGRNLTDSWESMLADNPQWPSATRGAVRDLAWTTLRDYGVGDLVLADLVSKPLPAVIHAVLLIALHRLELRPEQSHVIVDQAVEAAASVAPGLKGVVNGVLRNYLRRADEFRQAIIDSVCARNRHPDWWVARVQRSLPESWQRVLEAGNTHPPMSLRVNRRVAARDDYLRDLLQAGIQASPVGEDGLHLEKPVAVAELPGFAQGKVSVQDAGAQMAAMLLGAKDGERVLDACAAPGGKAAHILERAQVHLTALDVDRKRLNRVKLNLERLGLSADTRCGDARDLSMWWDGQPFDRILADVPCSASGVVRRHPDIKWLRRDADIPGFAAQQAQILEALWPSLAQGGTMLYATCSVFEEENGAQIAAFCDRHPDVERLPLHGRMDLQLLPDAEHDGFYYALLRKSA
jgi:16S rRNA (cytosine967-C5)-methyltransferase